MDFGARSVHHRLHVPGDKPDFDNDRTVQGDLLGDERGLDELLLDARQTADVVSGPVGTASPGMAANLQTPRLPSGRLACQLRTSLLNQSGRSGIQGLC